MDCGLSGSSVHGIFQATILEWVAHILLQGISGTQGSNLHALQYPALAEGFFTILQPGKWIPIVLISHNIPLTPL